MTPLDAALDYHARGWCTIPMKMETKRPACKWKPFQSRRPDEGKLREWFGNGSRHGPAVIFGAISGNLGSRDFDSMEAYRRWADRFPDLAATLPTVATKRPGRHVYFRTDPAAIVELRAALGRPHGTGAIAGPDGELRVGVGCYSVLPPSRRECGFTYHWLKPPDELPNIDVVAAGLLPLNREGRDEQREPKTLAEGENDDDSLPESLEDAPPSPANCLQASLPSLLSELAEEISLAIGRAIPRGVGSRHKAIFNFARELQAFHELAGMPPQSFKTVFREWYDRAGPAMKAAPPISFEEGWWDFVEGWPKVKVPKSAEAINMAFERAMSSDLPEVAEDYENPKTRALVGLCRELQRASGERPFFLASRTAARLLGVSYPTTSFWLRGLQTDGILKLESRGTAATGRASRYRYLPPI